MDKDFIKYKEASALQALGFDEPCYAKIDQTEYLQKKGEKSGPRGAMMYDIIPCPTYSQVFRWFRDNHFLQHEIISQGPKFWLLSIIKINSTTENGVYNGRSWELDEEFVNEQTSYEEAELACLQKIIRIVNNK